MSILYLLPKNNLDSWNLNSKDLTLTITSTGTYDVKIGSTSKLKISPNLTPGVVPGVTDITINNNYYSIDQTKFIVSSTDPASDFTTFGNIKPGDIWFNTTPPA
jgi:hypothetical protein